jgi:xanthine dehydrogenase YagS FAD-binding subunit
MTVLRHDELLTAVRYPKTWAGAKFYYEKVTDRNSWDFALVSVAAAMILDGNIIRNIRLTCGAVECVPRRLADVEQMVRGSEKNEEVATRAGKAAVRGATTLNFNQFKVPLMENLVRRAIRDA